VIYSFLEYSWIQKKTAGHQGTKSAA